MEGSIDHCEWSMLVGGGQCPGRILRRPCEQGHAVIWQTEHLHDRMLPEVIARRPLGLVLYKVALRGLLIANWPLCIELQDLAHTVACIQARCPGLLKLDRQSNLLEREDRARCNEEEVGESSTGLSALEAGG